MKCGHVLIVAALLGSSSALRADQLTGNLTADNTFTAYLSTSDSTLGTLIGSGSDWGTTYSLTPTTLAPGQTYYLHIDGLDSAPPAGFIGSFSLSGTSFEFENGTQSLVTDASSNWQVSDSGFGSGYYTPVFEAINGGSPWGVHPAIDSSANWIWGNDTLTENEQHSEEFFSTKITPLTSAVPLPTALPAASLLLAGLAGLQLRRRHA